MNNPGVNIRDGYYLDKTDNKRYSFAEAARQHRIYPTGGVPENAADALHTTVRVHMNMNHPSIVRLTQTKIKDEVSYQSSCYCDARPSHDGFA
jgi:hypothetical protein